VRGERRSVDPLGVGLDLALDLQRLLVEVSKLPTEISDRADTACSRSFLSPSPSDAAGGRRPPCRPSSLSHAFGGGCGCTVGNIAPAAPAWPRPRGRGRFKEWRPRGDQDTVTQTRHEAVAVLAVVLEHAVKDDLDHRS